MSRAAVMPWILVALVVAAPALAGCIQAGPAGDLTTPTPDAGAIACPRDPCAVTVIDGSDGDAHEPYVAVAPTDGTHAVVAAPTRDEESRLGMRIATTFDAGATWTRSWLPFPAAPAGESYLAASDPGVVFLGDGTVLASAIVFRGPALKSPSPIDIAVWRSEDGGRTFDEGRVVHATRTSTDPIRYVEETTQDSFDDKQFITVDRATDRVHLAWTRIDRATNRAQTFHAWSDDGGSQWSTPRIILRDFYYGVVMAALDETVLMAMKNGFEGTYVMIRSTDGGATWSTPVAIAPFPRARENYQQPALGMWRSGDALHAVVATVNGNMSEDLDVRRSEDAGRTWSDPIQVAPGAHATKKRLPHVAVDPGTDHAVLTFYDGARGPDDGSGLDVLALGLRDGHPFGAPTRLTPDPVVLGPRMWDYMGVGFGGGAAFAAWEHQDGDSGHILGAPLRWVAPS